MEEGAGESSVWDLAEGRADLSTHEKASNQPWLGGASAESSIADLKKLISLNQKAPPAPLMLLGSPTSAASSVLSTALSSDSMWFLLTCGFLSFGLRLFFLEWSAWKRRGGKKSRPRFTAFLEYRLDFFFSSYWWSKLAALSFLTILLIIGGAVTIATHTRLVAPPAVDGRESGGGTTSGGDGAPPAEAQDGAGAGEGNNSLIGAVLPGFGSALWDAWTFVADPGTHADVVG